MCRPTLDAINHNTSMRVSTFYSDVTSHTHERTHARTHARTIFPKVRIAVVPSSCSVNATAVLIISRRLVVYQACLSGPRSPISQQLLGTDINCSRSEPVFTPEFGPRGRKFPHRHSPGNVQSCPGIAAVHPRNDHDVSFCTWGNV